VRGRQLVTDPDNNNSGQGARPFAPNGPVVQFGVQRDPMTTFWTGHGYNTSIPDPYYRPLFNGGN